jgi:hypothetical protein
MDMSIIKMSQPVGCHDTYGAQKVLCSIQLSNKYGTFSESNTFTSQILHTAHVEANSLTFESFTSFNFRSASLTRVLGASLARVRVNGRSC